MFNNEYVEIKLDSLENIGVEYTLIKDNKVDGILVNGYNTVFYKTILEYLFRYNLSDALDYFENICFVVSSYNYSKEYRNFIIDLFNKYNCVIKFCKFDEIDFLNNDYNAILFENDSEFEAFTKLQTINGMHYDVMVCYSLNNFIKDLDIRINNYLAKINFNLFYNYLSEQGVKVFPIYIKFTDYILNFDKALIKKYKDSFMNRNNTILDAKLFYGDLYSEDYCSKISSALFFDLVKKRGYNVIADCDSEVFNEKDGCRLTLPIYKGKCNINIYGPCLIIGTYTDDEHTISSYLQKMLCSSNNVATVINRGSFNDYISILRQVMDSELNKGDIVMIFNFEKVGTDIYNIDLSSEFENNDISINDFVDTLFHFNHKVSEIFARRLYNEIKDEINNNTIEKFSIEKNYDFFFDLYFKRYFENFNSNEDEKIGSIVMNCNPFTYGHQYLIEKASRLVDRLIIFVVSEDSSQFSFYQRFTMVLNGTKHLDNVIVVPSGDYILSKDTFPEYFTKIVDVDLEQNIFRDLEIFCTKIAPKLNVKYRFAGTEPIDEITSNYNEMMKKVLKENGIEFIVIDRKKIDNQYISASLVRELINDNSPKEEILKYIPKTTYELIF